MNDTHRIIWTVRGGRGRTKMQVLEERAAILEAEAAKARAYIDGLAKTNCGLTCAGCGTLLRTEADFASHFIVRDENYLNLGNCLEKDK